MKQNIIITGVSGLLGTAISRELHREYNIIGIDQKAPKDEQNIDRFYHSDLTSPQSLKDTLQKISEECGNEITSIIHLAAYYDFAGEPSPLYQELTVNGTKYLLEQLHELKFNVEQFIFSSTHLVMKSQEKGKTINESSELEGTWDYPNSKIDAEQVIKKHHGDIPYVILRISGAYDEFGHSPPICQQIKRIYERQFESHLYPGDQEKGQPFVHIKDIVSIVKLCIKKRGKLGSEEVFLVAGPELLSYGQLQDRIGQLLYGKKWETFYVPKFIAKLGAWAQNLGDKKEHFIKPWMIDQTDAHYPISFHRAQEKLNWTPNDRLYDTLPIMISNLLDNPEKWYKENKLGAPPNVDPRIIQAHRTHEETQKKSGSSLGL